ncbi:hypothetical protein B0H21DRAFT_36827, partial [Amylocystis lapponica]
HGARARDRGRAEGGSGAGHPSRFPAPAPPPPPPPRAHNTNVGHENEYKQPQFGEVLSPQNTHVIRTMPSSPSLIRSHLAGPVRITRSISNLISPTPPSPRHGRPTKIELQTKLAPAHIRALVRTQRVQTGDPFEFTSDVSPRTRPGAVGLGIKLGNAKYPAPTPSPRLVLQPRTMSSGYSPSPVATLCLPFLVESRAEHPSSATNSPFESGLMPGISLSSENDEVHIPSVPGALKRDFRRTPGAPVYRDTLQNQMLDMAPNPHHDPTRRRVRRPSGAHVPPRAWHIIVSRRAS